MLPWIYSLQELFGLAIPLEPHAHERLVRTQVVGRDRQHYEKSSRVSFHARGTIRDGALSGGIVPSSITKSFLMLVPK